MIRRLFLSGGRRINHLNQDLVLLSKSGVHISVVDSCTKCSTVAMSSSIYTHHPRFQESLHFSSTASSGHNDFHGTEVSSLALDSNLKARVLESTLTYIPKYGWSREAIEACSPQGAIDIVLHFYASRNQQLAEVMQQWRIRNITDENNRLNEHDSRFSLSSSPSTAAEVDEFLYRALEYRLKAIVPYLDVWPQALGLLSLPTNIPSSIGMLAQLVDEIWAQAGDRSTDMSWYAKRLGLAYVYNLTELYMLQDKSPELVESWIFLRRRIEDLRSVKQMNLKAAASMLSNGVLAFGNVTCNILGWNRGH
ncbi:unnamed protein product [Heterobilharzia americana]|nr:unnamed protein product [Heterobilharzia americana]